MSFPSFCFSLLFNIFIIFPCILLSSILPVFYLAPPPQWRIGECSPDMAGTGEIKYPRRAKTSTAALQFDTDLSRTRGRKPWSKNHLVLQVGGWCSRPAPRSSKNRKLLKSPLETLWIGATYDDISYVRGLYDWARWMYKE